MSPTATTYFDRSDRVRLEVTGPDRAKFLHNLTTNDVKRLAEGTGHEAFITSPQGKTLAYVTLLATDAAILLRSDPGAADSFVPHLHKYGVFDDVALDDVSATTFEFHLVGPGAVVAVASVGYEAAESPRPLQHRLVMVLGHPVRLIRESPLGEPGWTWLGAAAGAQATRDLFASVGAVIGTPATFESRRIEAGTPLSGRDVQSNNLPQEVGRDARTINFVKGCYLGQETVARLDALGHVNRILRGGIIEGSTLVPPDGTPLVSADGKPAGSITSVAYSPERSASVFLAYVRVGQATPGTRLLIPSLLDPNGQPAVAVLMEWPAPR